MHPDYHSDHPGDCPICGMRLEPERGGAAGGDAAARALPHGAVQVSPERQQAIGIRLGVASRVAGTSVLRTTGRVAPDENRTYPIVAAVSGWIRQSGERHDGRRREGGPGARVVPGAPARVRQCAADVLHRPRDALPRRARSRSRSRDRSRTARRGAGAGIERMADGLRNMGVSNSQLRADGQAPRARAGHPAWSRRWTASS